MIILNAVAIVIISLVIIIITSLRIVSIRGNESATCRNSVNEAVGGDVCGRAQDRHGDHSYKKPVPLLVVHAEPVPRVGVLLLPHRRHRHLVAEVDGVEGEEDAVPERAAGCKRRRVADVGGDAQELLVGGLARGGGDGVRGVGHLERDPDGEDLDVDAVVGESRSGGSGGRQRCGSS